MPPERKYDYAMTEYSRAISRLGWSQVHAAKVLGINPRTSRRYAGSDLNLPVVLQALLRIAVHLQLDEKSFSPKAEPLFMLTRIIYKLKLPETEFNELANKPVKLTN
jgi:hypothetical protein